MPASSPSSVAKAGYTAKGHAGVRGEGGRAAPQSTQRANRVLEETLIVGLAVGPPGCSGWLDVHSGAGACAMVGLVHVRPGVGGPGLPGRSLHSRGLAAAAPAVLQHGHLDRLGTSTAFLYSTFYLLRGDHHQAHFFMDAGIILTLITLGKFLEVRSRGTAGDAIERLLDLAPATARLIPTARRSRFPSPRSGRATESGSGRAIRFPSMAT